ncbi:MAG: hypothetical protein AB1626_01325 [Candidatus Micrarchaeota archaeon]
MNEEIRRVREHLTRVLKEGKQGEIPLWQWGPKESIVSPEFSLRGNKLVVAHSVQFEPAEQHFGHEKYAGLSAEERRRRGIMWPQIDGRKVERHFQRELAGVVGKGKLKAVEFTHGGESSPWVTVVHEITLTRPQIRALNASLRDVKKSEALRRSAEAKRDALLRKIAGGEFRAGRQLMPSGASYTYS